MRKKAILYYGSSMRDLIYPMAMELQNKHNYDVILLYSNPFHLPKDGVTEYTNRMGEKYTNEFYQKDFTEVHSIYEIAESSQSQSRSLTEINKIIDNIERDGDVRICDSIRADRHAGMGFVVGADYPDSELSDLGYENTLNLSIDLFQFFNSMVRRLKPSFVFSGQGTLPTHLFSSVAKKYNIPVRSRMVTRLDSKATWAVDFESTPFGFHNSYREKLNSTNVEDIRYTKKILERPLQGQMIQDKILRENNLFGLFSSLSKHLARDVYRKMKGRKNILGDYYTFQSLNHIFRTWKLRRKYIKNFKNNNIDDISYVYYPLHLEPESTLLSESQSADNQLIIIDWIAKVIPSSWRLIIKEHPGFSGPRSSAFWEIINSYPNVLVVNPYEDSDYLYSNSRITATINGTIGFQASLQHIPVISFQKKYLPLVMDHVYFANSYDSVKDTIRKIVYEENYNKDKMKRQCHAFYSALKSNSIEIESNGKSSGNTFGYRIGDKFIEKYINLLIESLDSKNQVN
jgi:hypothetical protein